MYPRQGHRRGPGLGIALLAGQMAQVGFGNIPPVTLAGIVGQVVVYLRLLNIRWPSVSQVCVSTMTVWYKQDYHRLIMSAFFHADEWHLYFNMASFLWKGINLEPKVGSGYFMYMIAVFTVLTNALYVGLGLVADEWLDNSSYLSSCAVGFSGVLFALKVITTHMSPGTQRVMGFIPVPSQYACWAELILIHILVPRASFIGHLSGIIVGLLYVKGPLKSLMDTVISPVPTAGGMRSGSTSFFSQSRYRDWATSDSGSPYSQTMSSTRGQYTDHSQYTGGLSEEDQMQEAMRESLQQPGSGTSFEMPDQRRTEPSAPPAADDDTPHTPPPYPAENVPSPYPPHDPPPYPGHSSSTQIYPDLSRADSRGDGAAVGTANMPSVTAEEIRRRRLQRFNNT